MVDAVEDSIFDDVLMTPPSTDAETGTWDDDGPIRGWELRGKQNPARVFDVVIEDEYVEHGLECLLVRLTEYIALRRFTQDTPDYGECETYYCGFVHAPSVESFQKGYGGTYIEDCYPDDGWYMWDERYWSNRPGYSESMRSSAIRKTKTLARGLANRAGEESV